MTFHCDFCPFFHATSDHENAFQPNGNYCRSCYNNKVNDGKTEIRQKIDDRITVIDDHIQTIMLILDEIRDLQKDQVTRNYFS
jgi:hypothetical protein